MQFFTFCLSNLSGCFISSIISLGWPEWIDMFRSYVFVLLDVSFMTLLNIFENVWIGKSALINRVMENTLLSDESWPCRVRFRYAKAGVLKLATYLLTDSPSLRTNLCTCIFNLTIQVILSTAVSFEAIEIILSNASD